ncbi:MAG: hypothetical protein NT069_28340 [Planctomycetota bacterium]|nr:hypothetical protein [Planctomycetota bacterium]
MSYFGKILVVVQMALSILFMMFAGAVYTTHTNWRTESEKQKTAASKANVEKNNWIEENTKLTTQLKADTDAAIERAKQAEASLQLSEQQFKTSKDQIASLQTQLAQAQTRAQNSAEEALARAEEARELREVNHEQTGLISAAETKNSGLSDEIRKLTVELDIARSKNKSILSQISNYTALLAKNGISADETVDATSVLQPPPRIEGVVRTVRKPAKIGNAELLQISLGINDGLVKGHEMTVWRPGAKAGGKTRYLAKIRIVTTSPDSSVGEVIETTRTGAIQEGDNVSTKL